MTLWLITALATWEVAWQVDHAVAGAGTWPLIAWLIVPAGVVLLLVTQGKRIPWPVVRYWHDYLLVGCAPLVVFVALWSLATNVLSDVEGIQQRNIGQRRRIAIAQKIRRQRPQRDKDDQRRAAD